MFKRLANKVVYAGANIKGYLRPLLCLLPALFLFGCSFQASRPAPVYTLQQAQWPRFEKGSLNAKSYKVKPGDTLYSIAWGADKDFRYLAQLNKLGNNYTIYPGQVIKLTAISSKTRTVKHKTPAKHPHKTKVVDKKVVKKQSFNNENKLKEKSSQIQKKKLASSKNNSYAVTTGKQSVNLIKQKEVSTLPKKVGRWIWPANGKLIGTFSSSEQGNKGIKIAGSRGDIIKAAADGRVVYAGNALRGYGNLVIIKHSDDYLSAYAHADKILVKEKQQVSAGQTVARMGSSGTNQVMLHFEIRYLGKSVNPLSFLPRR